TQGKKRYGQLKQQIVGVSPKMLIQNLRNLERYGLGTSLE
ncbi:MULTISPECIES: winged helix-turn-helix transcriptional regulator, partial [Nostoc]